MGGARVGGKKGMEDCTLGLVGSDKFGTVNSKQGDPGRYSVSLRTGDRASGVRCPGAG